jgi:hypothetical protein
MTVAQQVRPITIVFADDGLVPNNPLPFVRTETPEHVQQRMCPPKSEVRDT